MVDAQLVIDVTGAVVTYLLPPLLLAVLFLFAWEEPLGGAAMGFGPRTFLLLAVGGVVGYLADLPLYGWDGSIMAINIGGALIPIVLTLALLPRILPGGRWDTGLLLLAVAAAVGLLLVLEVSTQDNIPPLAFLGIFGLAGALLAGIRAQGHGMLAGGARDLLATFGLLALVVTGTYFVTAPIPGEGIVAAFPEYLIFPVLAGVLAHALRWPRRDGPVLAYAVATLGVVTGADILHQPPLYGGLPFFGAIGGAGPFDLVYLSGPLALASALALQLHRGRGSTPLARLPDPDLGDPLRRWGFEPSEGVLAEVVRELDEEGGRTRRALGLPVRGPELGGLPCHPLLRADYDNLRALARTPELPEATVRAGILTGLYLRRDMADMLGRRLALPGERAGAFLLDLALVLGVGLTSLALLGRILALPTANAALLSNPFEAALAALAAIPFLLFAATEHLYGTTPGKWWVGLIVVGPDHGRPSLLVALGRNLPKLLTFEVLGLSLGVAVPYLVLNGDAVTAAALGLVAMAALAVGSFVGLWAIRLSPYRRRLGDVMGGTMVWRRSAPPPMPASWA